MFQISNERNQKVRIHCTKAQDIVHNLVEVRKR